MTMKNLVTVLALTTLLAGVAANAQQGSNQAADYALSLRMAAPSAYASARTPVRHPTVGGTGYDFQLQGR
jgi:hypothetical protein